ncbi:FBD-associated F-box protein At4g10400-like [Salvia splendens]|uniref:FBD-associated F-box protein At4g10400-like n=1 Tax=Salvia splendens TaxID=180675 RepID=UPI001C266929|nr:FBD-associated F-box protein At4g10400-like [Salvia splendens]
MAEDRINQLPDEILQHILSFIDIYEVVQTTILSKRWKDLWRSVLGIRLHIRSGGRRRRRVSQFLSHRDAAAPLHGFHLSFDSVIRVLEDDEAFVEECVLYAINQGVQSLRIQSPHRGLTTLRLPAALFTSTTLRELELTQKGSEIYVRGRLSLPN